MVVVFNIIETKACKKNKSLQAFYYEVPNFNFDYSYATYEPRATMYSNGGSTGYMAYERANISYDTSNGALRITPPKATVYTYDGYTCGNSTPFNLPIDIYLLK